MKSLDSEHLRESLAQRYKTPVRRAFFTRGGANDRFAFSHIVSPAVRTEVMAAEPAFTVHIHMAPLPTLDMWIDGYHRPMAPLRCGDVVIMDLEATPHADIHHPMDFLRIQFPKRALTEMAYDRGIIGHIEMQTVLGRQDPVLHGLSSALIAKCDDYGPSDQLFADHVSLAFHAHLMSAYGAAHRPRDVRGGLCPWQVRRACEMMIEKISGDIFIADLAEACGLSVSYFARAFRGTVGTPPHKWLMNERVRRAKKLLLDDGLRLTEIAIACGFTDQSHMSREFVRREGHPPGRWRRMRRL